MIQFTAKQKKQFARNLRALKDKAFPHRGGGKQIAAMLGVSPQLLSNWINGSRVPSALHLAKLAKIFNVSLQELCALPKAKQRQSAWKAITDLTRLQEQARRKDGNKHLNKTRLHTLNNLINNMLEEV